MRFLTSNFCRKVKKEWSAPTLISILLLFFMLIMFSLESIGLMNCTNNVQYRFTSPEVIVKMKSESREIKFNKEIQNNQDKLDMVNAKLDRVKEIKTASLNDLILEAAFNQLKYELGVNHNGFINEELEFYDM